MCMHLPAPGVLTLVLGGVAAVSALPGPAEWFKGNPWRHAFAILLFCAIAAGEIFIIHHAEEVPTAQRKNDNDAHLKELQKQDTQFAEQMASLWIFRESVERRIDEVNAKLKKAKTGPARDTLKIDALQLVKDIFQFAGDRDKRQPAYTISTNPAARQNESADFDHWRDETLGDYGSNFGQRIVAISNRFKTRGIDTSHLEFMCVHPISNTFVIPMCASELQGLVDRLP
jgi:hypothetical protein